KRIAARRGKKIAVVATASKMLRVIYQMLINKEEFKPFPVKSRKFSVG
ncbi:MAG TPA: IS110 family transposase, partial [Thermoplasmatales archaeon]|nr:IS110 family transposase [Thermoplasmatales archaeon]